MIETLGFVLNPLFLKSRDHLVWQAALVMLVNWQNTERIRQIWWISNNDSTDTHKYIWTNIYNTSIVILYNFLKMCSIVAIFFEELRVFGWKDFHFCQQISKYILLIHRKTLTSTNVFLEELDLLKRHGWFELMSK